MKSTNEKSKYLLMGMSHTVAIKKALNAKEENIFSVIDLNASPNFYSIKDNVLNLSALKNNQYKKIFLSIGGNFHNIFGLAENPTPLGVFCGDLENDIYSESRFYIPRNMLYDFFVERLERLLQHLDTLKLTFKNTPIVCLISPPPLESPNDVIEVEGMFREKLKRGVVPYQIRLEFYQIHCEIYRKRCLSLGIEVVEPPEITLNSKGFLSPDYSKKDPTHGNMKYGRKVLDSLIALNLLN